MNLCETCAHWTRQPDHVFQPTLYQKPAGPPIVTVFGICKCQSLLCGGIHPPDDGLCSDYGYNIGGDEEIYTGPKFGCVHHSSSK